MSVSISNSLYAEHFGFLEFPFGTTPNPRLSYENSLYREAFATLRYGIEARKGFIVITGEAGTGKTTLLRAFLQSVGPAVHTAFIFNPKLNFNQLVGSILADLGVACSSRDRLTLIETLNDYLIERFKKDHLVVLLVDEAQDLSDEMLEELRLLSNLETDRSRLMQIVLTGQPELEQRLEQPHLRQLKQRIALCCRLTPLPTDEVRHYIDHRLKMAGYQGKRLFERRAVERISRNSQGIPRLINVICDNALLIAYASSKKKVSAEIIEEVARDLELAAPSSTPRTGSVTKDFQRPRSRDEGRRAALHGTAPRVNPVFDESSIDEQLPKLYSKPKARRVGLEIFLALVVLMTGVGAVIYSRQDIDFVSNMAARVEDFSSQISGIAAELEQQGREALSDAAVKAGNYAELSSHYFSALTARMKTKFPQGTKYLTELAATMDALFQKTSDSVSETALKMRDYLLRLPGRMTDAWQESWDYLSGLAVKLRSLVPREKDSLKQANLIPKTSQDDRSSMNLADPLDRRPNDRPAPLAEEPPLAEAQPHKPESNEEAISAAANTTPEPQITEAPVTRADEEETITSARDRANLQSPESERAPSKNQSAETDHQIKSKTEPPLFLGDFEVFQDSFLRDKPQSDAAITVLPPGARVRVESRDGVYLRVRSLDDPKLRGYVHREDAFLDPIR